jgi:hypothetical protein
MHSDEEMVGVLEVAIVISVAALLAAGTFVFTRRLRLWLRLILTIGVFCVVVSPLIILALFSDEPLPGAKTVTPDQVSPGR